MNKKLFLRTVSVVLCFSVIEIGMPVANADEKSANKLLAQKVAVIKNMHKKAKRALVTAAQDHAFGDYFAATNDADRHNIKSRIDGVSLSVQSKFDVDEMCLIDRRGHEHSRIVGKAIAPDDDLSTEEASAPFFDLAFSMKPRQVAVARNYVSPDANRWVVAYVTPVDIEGEKPAFLHFEHNIAKYREVVNKGVDGDEVFVVLADRDGYVFSDSRNGINLDAKGDMEEPAEYFENLTAWQLKGMGEVLEDIKRNRKGVRRLSDGGGHGYLIAYDVVENWAVAVVEKL